jgi:shikimate 5-dehydrogenase
MIPPQKPLTGRIGHPIAENPIDRMIDAVDAHHGLNWQFCKNDIASPADLKLAVQALIPLGYSGMGITNPYKLAVMALNWQSLPTARQRGSQMRLRPPSRGLSPCPPGPHPPPAGCGSGRLA